MNYSELLNSLKAELRSQSKLKKLHIVLRILLRILFLPFYISYFFTKIGYWCTVFFYKMMSSPADHLHKWLLSQKDGVYHATQAVMYFVCLPTVFGFQVLLSFSAIAFYIQWFNLQILTYIISLGGTRWQPFINEATFDEE